MTSIVKMPKSLDSSESSGSMASFGVTVAYDEQDHKAAKGQSLLDSSPEEDISQLEELSRTPSPRLKRPNTFKPIVNPLSESTEENLKKSTLSRKSKSPPVADSWKPAPSKLSPEQKEERDKFLHLTAVIEASNQRTRREEEAEAKALALKLKKEEDKILASIKKADSNELMFEMDGGGRTRKKSRRFRNNLRKNLRKNKISKKYIMLKQCGGAKAKKGAKSNPFSSKAKASRSRRKGACYYKRKGRTLKLSKKGKKSRRRKRSRRRRRR